MSVMNGEKTHYKRHVFHLYLSAFDATGHGILTEVLKNTKDGTLLAFNAPDIKRRFLDQLEHLKEVYSETPTPVAEALGLSYLIQIFCLIRQTNPQAEKEGSALPENVIAIQRYIDQNFTQISSVTQIAEHFFYSREYVSRLFRKCFDISISDYVMKRQIEKSQSLILQGLPMIEIAGQVGFGSLSAFIRAFRSVTDMTPSQYRKLRKDIPSK